MAYPAAHEQDGTFFVESDEPARPQFDRKEVAKMMARNRQDMIANELSRQASDEYLEDIMQHMRHMEVRPPCPPTHPPWRVAH